MIKTFTIAATAVAACLLAGIGAKASTVTLTWDEYDTIDDARTARDLLDAAGSGNVTVIEDFEGQQFAADTSRTPLVTAVGTFTTIPGSICGASCSGDPDESYVRDSSEFGRFNTTDGGANWIDSNDNSALVLTAGIAGYTFDYLSFFLTDVDDVGQTPTFSIDIGDQTFSIAADEFGNTKQGDGDLFLVTLEFLSPVETAVITMNIDTGDGFGADDFGMGGITPVPLPASVFLLLGAVGGLGYMGRMKKA